MADPTCPHCARLLSVHDVEAAVSDVIDRGGADDRTHVVFESDAPAFWLAAALADWERFWSDEALREALYTLNGERSDRYRADERRRRREAAEAADRDANPTFSSLVGDAYAAAGVARDGD